MRAKDDEDGRSYVSRCWERVDPITGTILVMCKTTDGVGWT